MQFAEVAKQDIPARIAMFHSINTFTSALFAIWGHPPNSYINSRNMHIFSIVTGNLYGISLNSPRSDAEKTFSPLSHDA